MSDKSLPPTEGLTLTEISAALEASARGEHYPLESCLHKHPSNLSIGDTKLECHYVSVDSNGRARQRELIKIIARHVLDFSIPRGKIQRALEDSLKTGSTAPFTALAKESVSLFTDIRNTGEGGELLLFVLAEYYLRYPQVIPKMYLKTNPNMHVHGADGAFMGVVDDLLSLFWGESKIYGDFSQALEECVSSLVNIISNTSDADRDLELIRHNLDFTDKELCTAILNYMDIESPQYQQLKMCGICLIAFNYGDLTEGGTLKLTNEITENYITSKLSSWEKSLKAKCEKYNLQHYHLHVFFLPVESADNFRDTFLSELGV